jgi:hypothetical protein
MHNKELKLSILAKKMVHGLVSTSDVNKIKTETQIRKDNFYQLCDVVKLYNQRA